MLLRALALATLALLALATAAPAADDPAAAELATRWAPVLRLKETPGSCGIGDPYHPVDIDRLLGNDEVALRGPWDDVNVVKVAPVGSDLARGLRDYHLDYPGDALRPGCTYEQFQQELASPVVVYARVATQADVPGKIALQYWFYYVYNDWLNKHEGDWEMIQLSFDAPTAAAALALAHPAELGYSQHSSAERAAWGDPKIHLVDGTHPVVYPARGSQANFYTSDLYLMRSQAEGMGCDDTTGPSREIRPVVRVVPTAEADYLREYPWLGFRGRWGERQLAFFNGPTGPNIKTQWTRPFDWSAESWRGRSFTVPAGGLTGTTATDVFCGVVASGSEGLRRLKVNPGPTLLFVLALVVLALWAITRTTWTPADPRGLARRRSAGQLLAASARRYAGHPLLFTGIGAVLVPLGILAAIAQRLLFDASGLSVLVSEAGRRNAVVATVALVVGVAVALVGLAIVQAATAHAVVELDAGRRPTALSSLRAVVQGHLVRRLLLALLTSAAVQAALDVTLVLMPLSAFLLVRWSLLATVAAVEPREPGVLRRSSALVRRGFWRTAGVLLVTVVAVALGPLVGVALLAVTGASFALVNVVAAVIHAVSLPFAGIASTYLLFDLRTRPAPAGVEAEAASRGVA